MSIKSILCVFGGGANELGALNTSLALAEAYTARVRILHISPNPRDYVGLYGEDIMVSSQIATNIEKTNKERLEIAKQYVVSFAARQNIVLYSPGTIPDAQMRQPSAEFTHLCGDAHDIIARRGRLSDLIVIGRGISEPNALYDSAVITALFETGRPVLLMPTEKNKTQEKQPIKWHCKTASLAWDGGLEATQAMYNAMPFLERADKVQLLVVRGNGEACDLEAEEGVIEYLRCHGINATAIIVAAGNTTPAEALLARTKELQTDLLIMGAYGHSRFREMIFGGVTNYMLETADIPLLLSH